MRCQVYNKNVITVLSTHNRNRVEESDCSVRSAFSLNFVFYYLPHLWVINCFLHSCINKFISGCSGTFMHYSSGILGAGT